MRILFVSHYATPHIGGVETVIRSLRRELRRRGHEVRHVASNASHLSSEALGYDDEGVIRVRALNVLENRLGVPYPIFSPRLGLVLSREIAAADVVHAHGFLYMSSVSALVWARARRRRLGGPALVLTEHVGHVPYESPLLNRVESMAISSVGRLAVRSADAVVVLNRKVGAEIDALRPREPVLVLPNGVDTTLFRPPLDGEREALRRELGWDDTPRVLFVGRLVAKKGIEAALAATAAAGGAFRLVVAGPWRLVSANVVCGVRPRSIVSFAAAGRAGRRRARADSVGARGRSQPGGRRSAHAVTGRGLPRGRAGGDVERPAGGDDRRPGLHDASERRCARCALRARCPGGDRGGAHRARVRPRGVGGGRSGRAAARSAGVLVGASCGAA